jgi:hypothetical protein
MVYKFDPIYFNGTVFSIDTAWEMTGDWMENRRQNEPIPASFFPRALDFDGAAEPLPDLFHASRTIIVVSERARAVMGEWAPAQVEFIPVAFRATPIVAAKLNLASAYYFINVLGRARRLQWLDMPTRKFPTRDDGIERFGLLQDFGEWKLRERAAGEPLIWHDTPWQVGSRSYSGHNEILVEDAFWQELDAHFPDQLSPLRVGS